MIRWCIYVPGYFATLAIIVILDLAFVLAGQLEDCLWECQKPLYRAYRWLDGKL